MSQNALKKTMIFSSMENRTILEGIIKDRAITHCCSESVMLEKSLELALLPKHESARIWAELLYSEQGELSRAFTDFFGFVAAGVNWGVAKTNTKEMVMLFLNILSQNNISMAYVKDQRQYLHLHWSTLVELISGSDSIFAKMLSDDLAAKNAVHPNSYVNIILSNWTDVCDHTATFRFLSFIARSLDNLLIDCPENRVRYCDLLKDISDCW